MRPTRTAAPLRRIAIMTEKKIDLDFVISSYSDEKIVEDYVNGFRNCALSNWEKKIVETYLPKDGIILDASCGVGRAAFRMMELGCRSVIGVDISPEMVAAAREIGKTLEIHPAFHVDDITSLRFPDRYFDGVVAFHGITTLPSRQLRKAAMDELWRTLKPGRCLITSTFIREHPDFTAFWEDERKRWDTETQNPRLHELGDILHASHGGLEIFIHVPKKEEFSTLISECGYELVDCGPWDQFGDSDEKCNPAQKCFYWIARSAS
jgi:ubiquinone/menaquinone biosynthesis C-methylase UbiE